MLASIRSPPQGGRSCQELTHTIPTRTPSRRAVVLAGLLALAAARPSVLVLVLGNDSSGSRQDAVAAAQSQPILRSDGGPEESGVAASVGSRPAAGPDESRIATSIAAGSSQPAGGPDESHVAASISGR